MSKINYKLKAPHPLYGAEIIISKKQFNILPDNHKELFERGIFRKTYGGDESLSLSEKLSRRNRSDKLSKPGNDWIGTYYHPEIVKVQIPSHTDIPPFPPFEFNDEVGSHNFTFSNPDAPEIKKPESKYIKKSPWMSKKK